jgi:osomolarity two-component system sensor histidine kinase NIK1
MPNMDGLRATQLIREVEKREGWSRLPILGLTAHAIQGYQETCLSHGMDGYLGKPFDIKQLLIQMTEILPSDKKVLRDEG